MSYEDSLKKLLKPFPKEYVKDAPKGKFGKYVSHSRYVERLRDSGIPYSWNCEPIYGTHNGEKRIVGAKGTIKLGTDSYDGIGDVDTFKLDNKNINDGSLLKDAESDAFKRACMRFGLGVELWSGDVTEEEFVTDTPQGNTTVTKQKSEVVVEESKAPSTTTTTSSDSNLLFCPKPCYSPVKIYMPEDKKNPRSADFRCTAGGKCLNGEQKGSMTYSKSWYKDAKFLPPRYKEAYDNLTNVALEKNGITPPLARSLDEIEEGEAPF